mmetsp:Transcript_8686/g.36201  ORF Transcript_8686/g.36201 Transcript_8686/m.36201 type:complete len:388 (-) Transcript_8686:473-1636(-)
MPYGSGPLAEQLEDRGVAPDAAGEVVVVPGVEPGLHAELLPVHVLGAERSPNCIEFFLLLLHAGELVVALEGCHVQPRLHLCTHEGGRLHVVDESQCVDALTNVVCRGHGEDVLVQQYVVALSLEAHVDHVWVHEVDSLAIASREDHNIHGRDLCLAGEDDSILGELLDPLPNSDVAALQLVVQRMLLVTQSCDDEVLLEPLVLRLESMLVEDVLLLEHHALSEAAGHPPREKAEQRHREAVAHLPAEELLAVRKLQDPAAAPRDEECLFGRLGDLGDDVNAAVANAHDDDARRGVDAVLGRVLVAVAVEGFALELFQALEGGNVSSTAVPASAHEYAIEHVARRRPHSAGAGVDRIPGDMPPGIPLVVSAVIANVLDAAVVADLVL